MHFLISLTKTSVVMSHMGHSQQLQYWNQIRYLFYLGALAGMGSFQLANQNDFWLSRILIEKKVVRVFV